MHRPPARWASLTAAFFLTLVAAFFLTLVAAPAALAGSWLTPGATVVSGTASQPDGAVFDDGSALAIWIEGGAIKYADRQSGGGFGPPQQLGGAGATDLEFAARGNGRAAAAWRDASGAVSLSVRNLNGTWTPPQLVSAASNVRPAVGVGDNGDAIVVYQEGTTVLARVSLGGGPPGPTTTVDAGVAAGTSSPAASLNRTGTGVVAWRDSAEAAIKTRIRLAGSLSFEGEQAPYADGAVPPDNPEVAMNDQGVAALGFSAASATQDLVYLSRRVGGLWSTPASLDAQALAVGSPPQLAVGLEASNNAILAWAIGPGAERQTKVITSPAGGNIVPLGAGISVDVAANGSGAWVVAWIDHAGTALARARDTGQGIGGVTILGGSASGTPGASINGAGDAQVVRAGSVIATGYDNTGPTLSSLDAPTKANVGEAEIFAVSAADNFPLSSKAVWTFGEGSSRTGNRVKFSYKRAGRFTVSVTIADAAGFSTTLRRSVTVTKAPLAIRRAKWSGRYRESKLIGRGKSKKPYARIVGVVRKKTTIRIRIRRSVGGKPKGKVVARRAKVVLKKGPIGTKADIRLPRKMEPGRYVVETSRRSGPAFAPIRRVINVRGPAEGVADKAFVSNRRTGKPKKVLTKPKVIYGNFRFSLAPRSKKPLTITWYLDGRQVVAPVKQKIIGGWIRAERKSFLRNRTGPLPKGVYQARIRSGKRIVARATLRVR